MSTNCHNEVLEAMRITLCSSPSSEHALYTPPASDQTFAIFQQSINASQSFRAVAKKFRDAAAEKNVDGDVLFNDMREAIVASGAFLQLVEEYKDLMEEHDNEVWESQVLVPSSPLGGDGAGDSKDEDGHEMRGEEKHESEKVDDMEDSESGMTGFLAWKARGSPEYESETSSTQYQYEYASAATQTLEDTTNKQLRKAIQQIAILHEQLDTVVDAKQTYQIIAFAEFLAVVVLLGLVMWMARIPIPAADREL